ncbi:MAG TPA: CbiQ family ECF transporter T component [Ramlibacter sp.]|nr:CbiQ family ECF transporter T component [Ramlibacter sp.]
MGSLYSEERTWLHAVPAGYKLLLMAVLGTGLFLVDQMAWLTAGAGVCVGIYVSLGRAGRGARRMVVALLVMALLLLGFHALLGQPWVGIGSVLRLLGSSLLGISLTLTTRYTEWLRVFERLLAPLGRLGVRVDRLGLQLALMLRFTEIFFVQWKRLDDAHRLRTGKPGGLRLLAPMTIQMLLAARRVADTLRVRLGA